MIVDWKFWIILMFAGGQSGTIADRIKFFQGQASENTPPQSRSQNTIGRLTDRANVFEQPQQSTRITLRQLCPMPHLTVIRHNQN